MRSSELRLRARQSLSGNYWPAVLAAFVAAFFGALATSTGTSVNFNIDAEMIQNLPELVQLFLLVFASVAGMLALCCFVLGGVIQLGYCDYLLKQHDEQSASVRDLFSRFDHFAKGFLQMLLRNLFTFLWALLLIVPGIVKGLAYSMTPFLMAEDPSLSAREAIKLSEEKMKGHKWELFCLNWSFIGWFILAGLTAGIGGIFLNPYINAAYAAFYRDKIAAKAIPQEAVPELLFE